MLKVFFVLSISIRPIVAILARPRVRGTVKRRRGVLCGLFQLAKVTGTWLSCCGMSTHTFNLYRAVMQCARASTRHNQLLTDAEPRLAIAYGCGTRIYPRTGAILLAYVPTSFVE